MSQEEMYVTPEKKDLRVAATGRVAATFYSIPVFTTKVEKERSTKISIRRRRRNRKLTSGQQRKRNRKGSEFPGDLDTGNVSRFW